MAPLSTSSEEMTLAGTKRRNPGAIAPSTPDNPQSQLPPVRARIISGSVGSLITALAVTPLEVVKVHLQNNRPHISSSSVTNTIPAVPKNVYLCPKGCGTFVLNNGLFDCVLPKCAVPYFDQFGNLKPAAKPTKTAPPRTIKATPGTFAMVRNIFVKEGLGGIYAGLGPTLVMGIPSTAFYYTVYDELVARARIHPQTAPWDAWIPLVAGSSARLLSSLLTAPLELIRTRQASMVGEGQPVVGMRAEFQSIVGQHGVSALYKGLAPTLWRDVPFSGIYWLGLEQFQLGYASLLFEDEQPQTSLQQAGLSFISGASAGMVAASATTPFDVVKTRQQAVSETISEEIACNHDGHMVYRGQQQPSGGRPASVLGHMKTIYQAEGVPGLWRGNQTRMIKVAPSCAIMITCYGLGKRMLGGGEAANNS